jgi:hypothetical protein
MSQPAPEGCPSPPNQLKQPDYPLSEAPIEALARHAPALTGVELKVLLELTRRQLRTGRDVKASSRELATACKIGRSNTQLALDSLTARKLIALHQGTPTSPAAYHLNILETLQMGGPISGPPPTQTGPQNRATEDLFQGHGGPVLEPPPTESTALTRTTAELDFDFASLSLIDRVFSAKATDFDKQTLEAWRNHLWGIYTRFGRDENNRPFTEQNQPHPPTNKQVAEFLTVGSETELGRFLQTFRIECQAGNHPPQEYIYFTYIALHRVRHIVVENTRKGRAILQDVKRKKRQRQAEQLTLDDGANAGDMRAVVSALAERKKLG